ncbi:hypothetical protein PINS_up005478 [Pythium insidiosum]|nr:hypothetical protein PINS_up005478 [Pythium insidiosum]
MTASTTVAGIDARPESAAATGAARPSDVGILAMEVYFPATYVDQRDLEQFDGVPEGKYTKGLGQDEMSFTGDREDPNSIALTVVAQLLEKYRIDPQEIGRVEVGTETLVDKSKSTKTVLMQLFEPSGNTDIEGVTTVNACYGGTAALLNAVAWVESSAWDGRFAIVVATDIAVYARGPARPTSGCGAIAMLVGAHAPLVVESRTRATHASHIWDFYKPDPAHEFPTVDGRHSQSCYLRALDDCYLRFCDKNERLARDTKQQPFGVTSMDFAVFHSPYNKLVQKSFSRLFFLDARRRPTPLSDDDKLAPWKATPLEDTYTDRTLDLTTRELSDAVYRRMAQPCHAASKKVGNCYTASVYFNLANVVAQQGAALRGKRVLVFSYGSGSMASMFEIRAAEREGSDGRFSLATIAATLDIDTRLAKRTRRSAEDFSRYMDLREQFHGRKSVQPVQPVADLFPGTFYLEEIDDKFQRKYARKPTSDVDNNVAATAPAKQSSSAVSVYVSGVSVVLPGPTARRLSGGAALEQLLRGDNCIEQLPPQAVNDLLARGLVQLRKTRTNDGETTVQRCPVTAREQSIQVAAVARPVDLVAEYQLSPAIVDAMDDATRLAVAAGLDAMQRAGLVRGDGGDWRLPEPLRPSVGIVYATSYPCMHASMAEAARFYSQNDKYELDRKFLFRVLVLANAQLAQITGAQGPNIQSNGACAGMTQAIALAHDWLALQRCDRVVVVSSDVASSAELLPWIGGGFRVLGASSIAPTVETAALPFDARRNGMIVGGGAAAVVLESARAAPIVAPSMTAAAPLRQVRLLATRFVNSAYHGAAIDVQHVAQELSRLLDDVSTRFGISRELFATHGVYYSHETFTNASPTASCAYAEIQALRTALGPQLLPRLMITNTKGFTGHPMAVSFEDVAAVEGLRSGRVPPVANFKQHDTNLSETPLRLATTRETHYDHHYALRFAAGFGSQVAFTFYAVE